MEIDRYRGTDRQIERWVDRDRYREMRGIVISIHTDCTKTEYRNPSDNFNFKLQIQDFILQKCIKMRKKNVIQEFLWNTLKSQPQQNIVSYMGHLLFFF